jgi:hypothetical protein
LIELSAVLEGLAKHLVVSLAATHNFPFERGDAPSTPSQALLDIQWACLVTPNGFENATLIGRGLTYAVVGGRILD